MTITINLTSSTGVNFNTGFASFFADFMPIGWPYILGGGNTFQGDQIVLLDEIESGKGSQTKAIILDGTNFNYYFNDHTLSGTLTSIRLSTLGDSYNPADGSFDQDSKGHITNVSTSIEITGLDISNAYRERGDLHDTILALMGGGHDTGGTSDPSVLEEFLWAEGHKVNGSAGADTYSGTTYADTVYGNGGNDTLAGGAGNDTIDGGAGSDTAVYTGNKASYAWAKNSNGTWTVTDKRTSGITDGVDTLSNIEYLKFADGTTALVETAPVNAVPVITSNGGGASASVKVAENKTAVTTVTASDPEKAKITYSISGVDAALFTINAATGALAFKEAPDYEAPKDSGRNNVYDVTLTAKDAGGATDTQALAVTVTNANEAPVITSNGGGSSALVKVAENETAVTTVTASDPEMAKITYSISGADASLFTINASTGALAFKAAPNYEAPKDAGKNNVYDVTVTAIDAGGATDTQAIAVTVVATNVNAAPVIGSNGGGSSAAVKVAENKTAVTTVKATDPEKTTLTYSISGGADKALFTINASTGTLAFKTAPDYEVPKDTGKNNVYDVTVTAKDAGGATDTQAIAVKITDVNEAPLISSNGGGSSASVKVAENKTAVTTLKAADPEKKALTYSISGGADKALFAINAKTGVLSFKSAPDYEAPKDAGKNNVYDVTVRASDGKLTDTQALKVAVSDVKGKTLGGTSKADKLAGTVEADILDGKAGADTLAGGKGNDTYIVDNAKDKVAEKAGEGTDLVKSSVTHTLASNVENLSLTGSKAINGTGNTLANVIAGNGAANTLTGGSGNDILKGGAGNDKLYGGSGADTLAGGSGADTFIYKALGDSTAKSYDTIADFSAKQKDRIDLSAIDANGIGGTKNDAFVYIGTKGFSGTAGELRFTNGVLQGDVNGDRSADLAVKLTGVSSLTAGNVIL
ncbi:cadherin domain-containing protein [Xanthobacter sediminis]